MTTPLPTAQEPAVPSQSSSRRSFWRLRNIALLLLTILAATFWYSTILRPEERRMVGVWEAPGLWLSDPTEAIEFQGDRTTVPFAGRARPVFRGFESFQHRPGDTLTQSGKLGDWRRQGDEIYITRRDPELNLMLAKVQAILKSLMQGRGFPQDGTTLRVVEESADRMAIDDLRYTPPRRIIFLRLQTSPDQGISPRLEATILSTTHDSAP